MKTLLISILFFSFLFLSSQYAQDIKAKLAGNQATNGFTVVDDNDKVLFKVTGEGNVGINTDTPTALFDVQGGTSSTGSGRGISIIAETGSNQFDYAGGNILLKGGNGGFGYGDPAQISIGGGINGVGGDLNLFSGHGPDEGGDINIISSVSGLYAKFDRYNPVYYPNQSPLSEIKVGDINIGTEPSSNLYGGKISIYTGDDNAGGGDIEISTGNTEGSGNKITLRTGGGGGGSDIVLEAGSSGSYGGDDIVLIPNSNGGFVLVNGSGTYTGSWNQASDERYKKDVKPLENSLDKIIQLIPVKYEWKKDEYPDKNFQDGKQIGLIAQDVEKIIPILVSTDSEGYKSIDYSKINVLLIEAIKEQRKSIEDLKKEVGELRRNLRDNVSLNTRVNN